MLPFKLHPVHNLNVLRPILEEFDVDVRHTPCVDHYALLHSYHLSFPSNPIVLCLLDEFDVVCRECAIIPVMHYLNPPSLISL